MHRKKILAYYIRIHFSGMSLKCRPSSSQSNIIVSDIR